jgi:putative transposase
VAQKKIEGAGLGVSEKRTLIESSADAPSIRRQCDLVGLHRSSWYTQAAVAAEPEENLDLMTHIDEFYTAHPFYGSRKMVAVLGRKGFVVNRKRVQRLMRLMGLQSVAPRPNTSRPHPQHKVYPYLLRGLSVVRPGQVYSTDITYIRVGRGFAYLTAVIDWHSRQVLSWRLSNTMDTAFCVEALEEALERYGAPEIFNTDQGSQFTSVAFTGVLKANEIKISMDGKGRALDNIFVERLWRSVKYEEVYLKQYQTMQEARDGLSAYFRFYNHERPHQSLNNRTPAEVHGTAVQWLQAA